MSTRGTIFVPSWIPNNVSDHTGMDVLAVAEMVDELFLAPAGR
ncbi:hypothetical protein DPM33_00360 [Mesorhizobium hawassense]|uniref:Uncharacterized protein n=1 Tax=Mesorhizobium hawassense TaxID=1209954 RepID=A0A330HUS8_9HYPH|nr:hypothetical protein DPM33_00360 [Mesorhizobium hawassense]